MYTPVEPPRLESSAPRGPDPLLALVRQAGRPRAAGGPLPETARGL